MHEGENMEAGQFLADKERYDVMASARHILGCLDVDLEYLSQFIQPNSVVDLGCGQGQVGRAGKLSGVDSIVSIYNGQENPNPDTPNLIHADALKNIPLESGSVKFLFSRNGPHLWNYSQAEAIQLFTEINRILDPEGEARFHVPWLGFKQLEIAKRLKGTKDNKLQGIWNQLLIPTDWRGGLHHMRATAKKIDRVKLYLAEASRESTEFLQHEGFNIELVDSAQSSGGIENEFWLLKKNSDLN